jgi:alkylation response protein AidB-like acyl-CoA dehydrogenase
LEAIAAGDKRLPPGHAINPWIADGDGEPLESIDPLRNLAVVAETVDDPYLLDLGALMGAAQLVGLADAMLAQATEYAKVRQQFGQPIGAFQAVKHQLATCAVAIEFAKPVLWRAAQALGDGRASAPVHVSHAKVAAVDAAIQTAETAIQVHGAMGYTYEVDLHFWVKRAWALAGAWGNRACHLRRIDAAVLGGTLPIGPEHTFA